MSTYDSYLKATKEIGTLTQVNHSIGYIDGLPGAFINELILFEDNSLAQVIGLYKNSIEVLFLSNSEIKPGIRSTRTSEVLKINISEDLLGTTLDSLGNPISPAKTLKKPLESREIDTPPPPISMRTPIVKPLHTGISLIDIITPLGHGQRELVIGNKKTGKSNFLLRTLTAQAQEGTICIVALIGKRQSDIKSLESELKEKKVLDKTIIVASRAFDSAGIIFLTPFTAMAVAEYFRDKGHKVIVFLDDLSNHANIYREISLLAKRFPGRSSYPGDIFYTHARLMERAGNFTKGTITCFPVIESKEGDLSGFIPTNVMSMTDGHLFFDEALFNKGLRPAVNHFLSVTRVGKQTQDPLFRDISREVSGFLIRHQSLQEFIQFGAETNKEIQLAIAQGDKLIEFFKQETDIYRSVNFSAYAIGAIWSGILINLRVGEASQKLNKLGDLYSKDANVKNSIDQMIKESKTFLQLVQTIKNNINLLNSV